MERCQMWEKISAAEISSDQRGFIFIVECEHADGGKPGRGFLQLAWLI